MSRNLLMKLAALLIVIGAAAGAAVLVAEDQPEPVETARPYLELWEGGRFEDMKRYVSKPPPGFADAHRKVMKDLKGSNLRIRPGRVNESEGVATARFTASMKLAGLGDWTYRGRLILRPAEERWLVEWGPETIHPSLGPGLTLKRVRTWPQRAPILSSDGTPIVGGGQGVVVGLQPNRVTDENQVAGALQTHLGSDPAKVLELLEAGAAKPDQFVPVEEISETRYAEVRPAIYEVPGLVFQRKDLRLPPSEEFARQLIGRVGPVTREGLEKLGDPYIAGDVVGQFGLEAAMERRLAGRPSGEIRVVDEKDAPGRILHGFTGEAPREVRTSLDMDIQRAADATLEGIGKPSALVAIDSASGQVRAVANRPTVGFNRAVSGRYPPGSTFKVVATAALLASGVDLDQKVDCPAQSAAGGRTFRNFEGQSLGQIDFRTAFKESCNTAFVNLVRSLETERLSAAAESFGFGAEYSLQVRTAGGRFPPPGDTTERVAAAIGQARVEASPLHMASVAAAVASGTWRPPSLIVEESTSDNAPEPKQLDPSIISRIQELMRLVVADGTAERARVAGRQVAGKTGTAEFGTSKPPRTHAWFIGFSGPLAFAVLVEDGGVGGEVAAPLAAEFLSKLGGG